MNKEVSSYILTSTVPLERACSTAWVIYTRKEIMHEVTHSTDRPVGLDKYIFFVAQKPHNITEKEFKRGLNHCVIEH